MATNDQTVLEQVLSSEMEERGAGLSDSDFFELFVVEQVLKDRDLNYDEIDTGLVDGEKDGAVDGLYIFVDDELAIEDADFSNSRKGVAVELVVVQAKREASFKEVPVDRLAPTLSDLLPLSANDTSLKGKYREDVLRGFSRFRKAVSRRRARLRAFISGSCTQPRGISLHRAWRSASRSSRRWFDRSIRMRPLRSSSPARLSCSVNTEGSRRPRMNSRL